MNNLIVNGWLVKEGENLSCKNLQKGELSGICLRYTNISLSNLSGSNLEKANLKGTNLYKSTLWSCNLQGANLKGANLKGADLYKADLQGANLEGADLRYVIFNWTNLEGVTYNNFTRWPIDFKIPLNNRNYIIKILDSTVIKDWKGLVKLAEYLTLREIVKESGRNHAIRRNLYTKEQVNLFCELMNTELNK